ncbi:MAG: polysaccharide biosynthesis/export family protein [Pigmentiphaga sp.]|uniref:polysaccharide biosynthesis/export family protein n=1 Tax=Pigmentiphaga sp. TaxID=1977564 RepID=UPI0029B52AC6|nr:polysaccharide biosynthesis/export family protein [Pigmentiphaga sp.]MDX3905540.1 polysaccharide biosynthesis/export family protein [Pigmentiphaga sp.]
MKTFIETTLRTFCIALVLASLGACAFAPGMRFDPDWPVDPNDPSSVPTMKQITPSLVLAEKHARESQVDEAVDAMMGNGMPYVIGPGDILSIVVWDHPELVFPTQAYAIGTGATELTLGDSSSNIPGYPVSSDGYIQFPYLGLLKVAGLTEIQVRDLIIKNSRDYIRNPQITVRVLGYRSKRVHLEGELKNPGTVAMNDLPLHLMEAINRAGGILPSADRSRIFVLRGGKAVQIDLPRLIERGVDLTRIMLKPGDIVRVSPRDESRIFVMGEVYAPQAMNLRDGRMSLTEALGAAGGPNQSTADPAQIFVVRTTPQALPEVYHLDSSSASALAVAEQFQLKPKDVVFVDTGNLGRWNRFISLLFPSAQTVQTAAAVGR